MESEGDKDMLEEKNLFDPEEIVAAILHPATNDNEDSSDTEKLDSSPTKNCSATTIISCHTGTIVISCDSSLSTEEQEETADTSEISEPRYRNTNNGIGKESDSSSSCEQLNTEIFKETESTDVNYVSESNEVKEPNIGDCEKSEVNYIVELIPNYKLNDDGGKNTISNNREIKIPCLKDKEELGHLCTKLGLKMEVCDNYDPEDSDSELETFPEDYEVEAIVDYSFEKGEHWYLVKWKNWPNESNTWEPRKHLSGCKDLLKEYHNSKKGKRKLEEPNEKKSKKQKFNSFILDMCKPSTEDIATLLRLRGISINDVNANSSNILKIKRELKQMFMSSAQSNYSKSFVKKLKLQDDIWGESGLMAFAAKRKDVLKRLKIWERKINSLCVDTAKVVVENHVDLEGPPEDFTYITDYKPEENIIIPDDPIIGCTCGDCYENRKNCCAAGCGGHFAYNKFGFLSVQPGTPIYECNKRCHCLESCVNRVVQKGRKIQMAIFRTSDGRGWGVKTLEKIRKGTFVMEYVGEVITNEEAEKRGQFYDAEGRTYLFDLDYNVGDCPFTVDAARYGNVAHFMNHSCDPNLNVYGVWINNLDPRLPRIAFFAKRDIKKREELTFDYQMTCSATDQSPSKTSMTPSHSSEQRQNLSSPSKHHSNSAHVKRIPCKCGTSKCRKFLF